MYELKCGGLLMVGGWSVDCQSLPPRSTSSSYPVDYDKSYFQTVDQSEVKL